MLVCARQAYMCFVFGVFDASLYNCRGEQCGHSREWVQRALGNSHTPSMGQ